LGSEEFQAAAEHIRTVLEMAEPESNAIESVGLRSLAATLADFPRDVALRIAHKMGMPMGMQLLSWRDQLERSGKGNPRSRNEEILRKAGEMAADRQTRAGRSNRRAGEPS
ncbi:MAG: hypothetical protein KC729_14055, partial [Candidatus Eisenbacteria bacterium]|nr:hypothetical protein [Candidatus Eisenbacteria bacterium]